MTTPNSPAIELPPDLEAIYANMVRISHSPAELVFDFARMLPGMPSARRHSCSVSLAVSLQDSLLPEPSIVASSIQTSADHLYAYLILEGPPNFDAYAAPPGSSAMNG